MLNVYDKRSAGEALGISEETIDKYRKEGKLPFRKVGTLVRFTEGDLLAFLDACAVPAVSLPSPRQKLEIAKRRKPA